ncbi:hypothetical protein FVE85_0077 [Porphyridium purpureum]|uniref:Uncharacterized protein n=1 Tax=Porphyridium purpureum TaxID=35688 RepID=A0A5J4YZ05_PORPP|nr:hypothetical protein FVE85_0077 [Porphyridium purpureum]|eukprot:POR8147..scf208_2
MGFVGVRAVGACRAVSNGGGIGGARRGVRACSAVRMGARAPGGAEFAVPETVMQRVRETAVLDVAGQAVQMRTALECAKADLGACDRMLASSLPKLNALNTGLVAVSIAVPEKLQMLANGVPFPSDILYGDPDRAVYTELGFVDSFKKANSWDYWNRMRSKDWSKLRTTVQNYAPIALNRGMTWKQVSMQGGTLILNESLQCLAFEPSQAPGDHPSANEVLQLVETTLERPS